MGQLEDLINKKMIFLGSRICMTKDIGIHNNMFGGELLGTLDAHSAIFAAEICDSPLVVTRCIEKVEFDRPVKVGQIIKIYGGIDKIGNTSITLNIEIRKHNVHTEAEQIVLKTKITFVKVDDEGSPIPISDRIKAKFGFLEKIV
jgi:acyl-CoA thioesterase YciA